MTISEAQIHALIAEIDDLLVATDASTISTGEMALTQRDLLEKIRWILGDWGRTVEATPLANPPLGTEDHNTAQAIAQSVMAQLNLERSQWLQPLQLELETLRQQRESLLGEIRHLETHQRQLTTNFLNALLNRCSDSLRQELSQTLERLQMQALPTVTGGVPPSQQWDWLEQLRSLQTQSDQLLRSLDSTFHHVFGSLEQDLHGYHKSLTEGIAALHTLGQYSETLITQQPLPALPQPLQLDPTVHLDSVLVPVLAESPRPPLTQVVPPPPEPTTPDEAWEVWDEYLFNSDAFANPVDPPMVLTVSEQELAPPPPEPLMVSPDLEQTLFDGLDDPAAIAREDTALTLPIRSEIEVSVETILFEDYLTPEEEGATGMRSPTADLPDSATSPQTAAVPTVAETMAILANLLAQVSNASEAIAPDEAEDASSITPGETLLATAEVEAHNAEDLEETLSAAQLQQLSEDLARFEEADPLPREWGSDLPDVLPEGAATVATSQLPDLPAVAEAVQSPETPETIDDLGIDAIASLNDLFGDNDEPATFMEPELEEDQPPTALQPPAVEGQPLAQDPPVVEPPAVDPQGEPQPLASDPPVVRLTTPIPPDSTPIPSQDVLTSLDGLLWEEESTSDRGVAVIDFWQTQGNNGQAPAIPSPQEHE